jgi:ribosomal protein S6
MALDNKQYEISYLARTEADKDAVIKIINEANAENVTEGRILEIKLAYPVKKQTSAFFGFVVFEALPETITKINDSLKFAEGILRFLIITPPPQKPQPRFFGRDKSEENLSEMNNRKVEEAGTPIKNEEEIVAPETETEPKVDDAAFNEKLEEILG